MTLRAIVIGAGWAGEGHSKALRAAGVEIVAICGRTPEPAQAMARKLGIADVRLDWRAALQALQPDLVTIATPGHLHAEMVLAAAGLGCHILCEKPLGLNADQARAMLQAVEAAGVKHAYGATSRYAPAALYAQRLLASGLIGQVQEIECIHHFNLSPLTPASWFFQLSQGGGALYTDFPHFLGQVLFMTGGQIQAVCGSARPLLDKVPVGAPVHDFRASFTPLDPQQAESGRWQPVDADMGYTILGRLQMPAGNTASVLWQASEMAAGRHPNALAFYGSQGSLHLNAPFFPETIEHFAPRGRPTQQRWQEMQIPDEFNRLLAWTEDPVQSAWHQLVREFVADVRGEGYSGYPTFHDGWVANTIIDIVRSGQGWTALPAWSNS
ncbi:MAG: gfo/Idh/MocA family oxidoreductase [Caldilinea sp. CFX5]|nr:gfo/Idh/MocA family oxidoreductase [Caldilinea sp. CFX5]